MQSQQGRGMVSMRPPRVVCESPFWSRPMGLVRSNMHMFVAVVMLIVSTALLMVYLQAFCQSILRREFGHEFFHSVVNANRLEFPFVRKALEEFNAPVDYERFRMQLKCDFLALTYLLKNAGNAKGRLSKEERFLTWYFRVVVLKLIVAHSLRLGERAAVLKLTSILEYFANVLGERVDTIRFGDMTASDYLMSL